MGSKEKLLSLKEDEIDAWFEKGKTEGYLPLKALQRCPEQLEKRGIHHPCYRKLTSVLNENPYSLKGLLRLLKSPELLKAFTE